MPSPRPFRLLLKLLPFEFRRRYGTGIEQAFHDERQSAHSPTEVATVWTNAVTDIFSTSWNEHLRRFRQDLHYALRDMRRRPGFVLAAVLTLAVGIGMNGAMFSVLYSVLLRPLPYSQSQELVAVWNRWEGRTKGAFSDPEYLDLSETARTMKVAAFAQGEASIAGDDGNAERLPAAQISTNALDVLGVAPIMGRGFATSEEVEGLDAVLIISERLWESRFGRAANVIGKTLLVDGRRCEIVGVLGKETRLPLEFGTDQRVGIIRPLTFERAAARNKRGGHYLRVVGRIAPGMSTDAARAELDHFHAQMRAAYPNEYDSPGWGGHLGPLRGDLLGDSKRTLLILSLAVGLVLLLACANVANLMLARGEARRTELSIRMALGASRLRIVRQLVTEGLLLSAAGAFAGLALAAACQKVLLYWASNGAVLLPRLADVSINLPVIAFVVALALLTPLLFGLFPALPISGAAGGEDLHHGARSGTQRLRPTMRKVLVMSQVMIATVLLIASGLLVKSMVRLLQQPSGVSTDRVLTFRVSLPDSQYQSLAQIGAYLDRLRERIVALPGVKTVGASSGLPMAFASGDWSFDIDGRPAMEGQKHAGKADWYVVTPGYFETLGVQVVRGRLPQASDTAESEPAIFLNESAARAVFPNEDPVGHRMRLTNSTGPTQPWRTIAGVVKDVRMFGLDSAPHAEMYLPQPQFLHFSAKGQVRSFSVVARSSTEPLPLMPSVRAEMAKIDPLVAAAQVKDMETVVSESTADRKMTMSLVGAFGGMAILLAIIGVYGVMDYTVLQRRREIGVRLAVGATREAVQGLILRDGMKVVAGGIAGGALLAAAFGSVLAALLYNVRPRDAAVYSAVAVVVGLVALLAIYVPARRGSRLDPMVALRAE